MSRWTIEEYDNESFVYFDDTHERTYNERNINDFSLLKDYNLQNHDMYMFMYAMGLKRILLTRENNVEYFGNETQNLMIRIEQDPYNKHCDRLWITKVYTYPVFKKKTKEQIEQEDRIYKKREKEILDAFLVQLPKSLKQNNK